MTNWSATRLWKALDGRLGDRETTAVKLALEAAELVLKSSSTSPPDFTLHDHDHSFRVAERIFDLVPDSSQMSAFELALLLLAAYVHDIGMSPSRAIVRSHYEYLATGEKGDLTPQNVRELQQWLDAHYDGATPPLPKDRITASDLRLIDAIVAYYSRHKHNDWSEDWARTEIAEIPAPPYPSWLDDLVTLCRSHHEGLTALRTDRFDAKLVGSPSNTLNLRYLAALLRVADVLDFDPERTPDVILQRRDIAPGSRIFWKRDHEVAFHIDPSLNTLLLAARTPSASIHRAVLEIVTVVNQELSTCAALEHEGLFRVGTIPEAERGRYHWNWPSQLTTNVSEKDNSFVYIDGAFRPDSKRVIELLSGTALYGEPLAAVRELIQNAVDAIKEQIAYERLGDDEPGSTDFSPIWSQVHKIRLTVEEDADGTWLKCVDDGVGMTKDIIENHMLVSGSAPRVSTRTLEREVSERGFAIGRTGQFGVGTLSYFMIADRLTLTTRQSAEAGDHDHSAWYFATEGLGSFGELMPASRAAKGTEVRLRLRSSVFGDKSKIFSRLSDYITRTVAFLPCKLELRDDIGGEPPLELSPGWAVGPKAFGDMALPKQSVYEPSDATNEQRETAATKRAAWETDRQDALSRLRWLGPEEVAIDSLAGRIRVWLPYFALDAGSSSVYLQTKGATLVPLPDGKHYLRPQQHVRLSWRGFKIENSQLDLKDRALAQIDLGAGATISVDRGRLNFPTMEVKDAIDAAALKLRIQFAEENATSPYNLLNLSTLRLVSRGPRDGNLYWRTDSKEWGAVTVPFTEIAGFSYNPEPTAGVTSNEGRGVTRVLRMGDYGDNFLSSRLNGGRLALTNDNSPNGQLQPAIVWDEMPDRHEWSPREFPPALDELVCVFGGGDLILNSSHPYGKGTKPLVGSRGLKLPADCSDDLLRASVIRSLELPPDRWKSIRDSDPAIARRVIESVLQAPGQRLDVWVSTSYDQYIYTLDREGHHFRRQDYYIKGFLIAYDEKKFELPTEEKHWVRISGGRFQEDEEGNKSGSTALLESDADF